MSLKKSKSIVNLVQLELLLFSMILPLLLVGCSDWFFPNPTSTPRRVAEDFFQSYNRYYAAFSIKTVNWDSIEQASLAHISENESDQALFQKLKAATLALQDGHATLSSQAFGRVAYSAWYESKPRNFLGVQILASKYVQGYRSNRMNIGYGRLSGNIGYIWIAGFGGKESEYDLIETLLQDFSNTNGLVIDIRENGGGSDANAKRIAESLARSEKIYEYVRWRNGPEKHQLTDYIPQYLRPKGEPLFAKPVVLITNRKVFSAAESFTLMLKTLPNVTHLGDTTGGGSANPMERELPNGWLIRIPRWIAYTPEKVPFEGKGIAPEIAVEITASDAAASRDALLEAAISHLTTLPE